MYGDIEQIIQQDSHKYTTSEGRNDLLTQKFKNCDIEDDLFCFHYFTNSLCLDIKNKMNIIEKLYLLVKILNMKYNNDKKCYGISTDSIRKLTDLFFIIIGEKVSTNIPLRKMYNF